MSAQYFRDQVNNPDNVDRTEQINNDRIANLDPLTDKVEADAALIHETPADGLLPHQAPVGETLPDTSPVDETTAVETWTNKSAPYKAPVPMSDTTVPAAPIAEKAGSLATLLSADQSDHFRTRWNEIQSKFVDEPRDAVQQADGLVSEVVEKITEMFTNEHSSLESQWKQGNDVSTEDLRKALQHYRSFFNRLVV